MIEGLVSIVLPIYNTEKYLDRCLNSIVTQTYRNIEIILVDDGSTDSSPQKCDDWKEKDSRIRVIHKQNAGLGMARNTGIDNANGQYILFLDGDDYISESMVEVLHNEATETGADIIFFGFYKVSPSGKITDTLIPYTEKSYYSGKEILDFVAPTALGMCPKTGKKFGLNNSAWSCMYSMELICESGWRFVSEREYISEDLYSFLTLVSSVKSASIVRKALYFYCKNNNSLTNKYRTDRFSKNMYLYTQSIALCEQNGYSEMIKSQVSHRIFDNIIDTLKQIAASDEPFSGKLSYIKEIVDSPIFQSVLVRANKKGYSIMRKVLFVALRKKLVLTTYFLVKVKR